jgi:hypothetical protein
MRTTAFVSASILLGSSLTMGCAVHGSASVNAPPPPEVVVQGQVQGSATTEIVVQGDPPPPPPPQQETVPPPPSPEYTWVGGYHRWDGHAYVWVNGRYERRPHEGATWRAAHWEPRGNGHVWIDGGWDGQAAASAPQPPPPPAAQAQIDVTVAPAPETEPEELVATSEPPELVYEEQTDSPNPGYVWIGGYWQWSGNDWVWYYGGWHPAPEGRVYVSPYYEHVNGHVVYVRGYWGARGEEPRYYGGDRIVFAAAVRPAGYVRGQHTFVARSAGLPPGRRGHYGPKPAGVIKKRPLPTASAPRTPVVREEGRGAEHAEVGAGAGAGKVDHEVKAGARPEVKAEGKGEAKPEVKTEPKGEAKPAPKPTAKKPPPKR